ncbi:MAG: S-layer homology domain-containing protein [Clostridiales bacterium]|nr:S-layer homology domain-containing protein [Clostridiales bacterium]
MKKQVSIAAVLLAMWLLVQPAAAFSDITDPETRIAAETLSALGVVSGFEDGAFRAGATLTRAQFSKMGVLCLSAGDRALLYQNYTIFPDVRSGHWATGYVNTAVKECKILSGYPDGTFRPDNAITEAEAVTICLRMLGYTEQSIGVFWPADYLSKAREIGLTGDLQIDPSAPMTRGRAAVLLTNLLVNETVSANENGVLVPGGAFAKSMGQSTVDGAILLATEESDLSLAQGVVRVQAGGAASEMAAANKIPTALVGRRGILICGRDGRINGFVPYQYTATTVVVKDRDANGVTTQAGGKIIIPLTTEVVWEGKITTYEKSWYDLRNGLTLNFFHDQDGLLAYIAVGNIGGLGTGTSVAHVLEENYAAGQNPLLKHYGADLVSKMPIYKHGRTVDASALRRYDVVTYNEQLKRFVVSNSRIAGTLQGVYPTLERAQSIRLYGLTFPMQPGYTPDLSAYGYSTAVTLLLTEEGTVAGVLPLNKAEPGMSGLLTTLSGTTATVELLGGHTIKAEIRLGYTEPQNDPYANANALYDGAFVNVTVSSTGVVSLKRPADRQPDGDLSLADMTLGSLTVAPTAAFYECAGRYTTTVPVPLKDLQNADKRIDRTKIQYYSQNSAGLVDAIVFENVTGNAFTYGILVDDGGPITRLRYDSTAGTDTATETVASWDETTYLIPGPYCGVSVRGGNLRETVAMERYSGIGLGDFEGSGELRVDGYLLRVAERVQVYDYTNDKFIPLSEAKRRYQTFEVYTDRQPAQGGVVRLIVVK